MTPAANFLRSAEFAGARTVLVNLEPMPADARPFGEQHLGRWCCQIVALPVRGVTVDRSDGRPPDRSR